MALPKLVSSKHTLVVPSTKESVEYRPYLVKEEKILMMAFESKDQSQMITALRDTIAGCTEGKIKVDNLTMFDLEYIFLKLRTKSVGENTKLKVKCIKCETPNEVNIDLSSVNVVGEIKPTAKIELTDTVGVMLKYPTVKGLYRQLNSLNEANSALAAIASAIESIYDADNVYPAENESEKSILEFIESLTSDQFKKIVSFFDDMPKLKHDIDFTCTHCKEENKIAVEGLQNFF
jgi:phage FluMu protein Com